MWGQLSTSCSNVLKQPNGELLYSCNQPQPATDNGVKDRRSNWLVAPPPSWAVPSECLVYSINQWNLSGNRTCNRSIRGNYLAYAATQSITRRIYVSPQTKVLCNYLNRRIYISPQTKVLCNYLTRRIYISPLTKVLDLRSLWSKIGYQMASVLDCI